VNWRRVARASELRPGEARRVVLDGIEIALCNVAGEIYAVDDVCTHAYASLSEGLLSGAEIECPLHGGCFDVRTAARSGIVSEDRCRFGGPTRRRRYWHWPAAPMLAPALIVRERCTEVCVRHIVVDRDRRGQVERRAATQLRRRRR
jgi:nitrite reductase/ring-hydroxylating ferredoxin subunit